MKSILPGLMFLFFLNVVEGQVKTSTNVIVVTLDGFRWQEVFGGADEALINDSVFTRDSAGLRKKYWAGNPEERRSKLFPFLWNMVAMQGQIYGNRWTGNYMNVKNPYWFSYPGYNEIFTGYPDTAMNTNDKIPNPNTNVLEFINRQPGFAGKVAAFTSWDVFDAILNEKRSGITVSSGFDQVEVSSPEFTLLNRMQKTSPQPLGDGVRPDHLTYHIAREYIREKKPRVVYISFDETDDYAHEGRYDDYLGAAHNIDAWMADLWKMLQSTPGYAGETTLVITCDHGRGDEVKKEWTSHGREIRGASQIWLGLLGSGIPARGEWKGTGQVYQAQLAQTIALLLGMKFTAEHPIEPAIPIGR